MKFLLIFIAIVTAVFVHTRLLDESVSPIQASATAQPMDPHTPQINEHDMLLERIFIAVANHPDAEVRTKLSPLLKSGEIKTAWVPVALRKQAMALFLLWPNKENRLMPTLAFDPGRLMISRMKTDLHLVIFHEYVHYKQWSQGRLPEELFMLRLETEVENANEWCEQKWYAEVEAYQKECEFAHRIGLGKGLMICTEAGGLDRKLLKSSMLQGEANASMCEEVWRNL